MNIIFDFDGTLFKTETVDVPAINDALKTMNRPTLEPKEIMSYIGVSLDGLGRACLKTFDNDDIRRFSRLVVKNELAVIPEQATMYPDAIALIKKLKHDGNVLAICSNGNKVYIKRLVRFFKLRRYFIHVWYKHKGRPKLDGANRVLKKMDRQQTTIFVGDRSEDIEVGQSLGLITVGMLHGFGTKGELSAADYLAQDINALKKILAQIKETTK